MQTMLERSGDVLNPGYKTWQMTFRIWNYALTVYVGRLPVHSVVGVAHRMTRSSICLTILTTRKLRTRFSK
jgi:hypothetical protein